MIALGIAPVALRIATTNSFFLTVLHFGIVDRRLDDLALAVPLAPTRLAWQLGTQAQARGEYSRAIDVLERGVRLDPDHSFLNYWLGWAYYETGDYSTAIAKWEHIDARAVLYTKGSEAYKSEQFPQAVLFLESTLRVAPTIAHAHYLLAYTYLRLGNPERAIREAQAAIRVDGGRNFGYRALLPWVYEQTGYPELAYEEYLAILAIAPDNSAAREGLARIQKAREEKRK
jgi:tetratricopeptide (TPR) repeat protein